MSLASPKRFSGDSPHLGISILGLRFPWLVVWTGCGVPLSDALGYGAGLATACICTWLSG